jgi:hypothetical protein
MALLYQAELRPSKIELIKGWAPTQPWFEGSASASLTSVGSFRFDDPNGRWASKHYSSGQETAQYYRYL